MLCLLVVGVTPKTKPTRGIFGCVCAEPASGHPTAAPPNSVMNSRRFTQSPRATRMLEYQMSHASTKAFAAAQIAEARDVGCGSGFGLLQHSPARQKYLRFQTESLQCSELAFRIRDLKCSQRRSGPSLLD